MRFSSFQRPIAIITGFLKNVIIVSLDTALLPFLSKTSSKPFLLAIVRLDDIGDFILWLRDAKRIREHYSKYRIILIANQSWANLAQTFPYWDEVLPIDVGKLKTNLSYRLKIFREVRNLGLEVVIQPTHICFLETADTVVRVSNAKTRIGSIGNTSTRKKGWQKRIANTWYSDLINASPQQLTVLERNAEFTDQLTSSHSKVQPFALPELNIPINHLTPANKYFLIFPGSNGKYKIWPKERFASLTSTLTSQTGCTALICGTSAENDLCSWIASNVAQSKNLAGRTSLLEATELIRNAEFVIGNDSGSVHIAAATNTTSFAILGGGHYGQFLPYPVEWDRSRPIIINHAMPCYGCGWRCHFTSSMDSPYRCITEISVEFASQLILMQLEKKGL